MIHSRCIASRLPWWNGRTHVRQCRRSAGYAAKRHIGQSCASRCPRWGECPVWTSLPDQSAFGCWLGFDTPDPSPKSLSRNQNRHPSCEKQFLQRLWHQGLSLHRHGRRQCLQSLGRKQRWNWVPVIPDHVWHGRRRHPRWWPNMTKSWCCPTHSARSLCRTSFRSCFDAADGNSAQSP